MDFKFSIIIRNFLFFVFVYSLSHQAFAKQEIRIQKPQSNADATHGYYLGLIKLALAKINKTDEYEIKYAPVVLSQGRAISELTRVNGLINVHRLGTTVDREKKLIAIKIPLLKGSLGYRIAIIHHDNLTKFDQITSLQDLQKFSACQGAHWPDSDILEASNLTVIRNDSYKGMFDQTEKKYCDYFPRAIIEAKAEIIAYNNNDTDKLLQVYDKFIISYPFPMYFFVSPHQPQLAKDLEEGLRLAIADGSFDRYFKSNEITKHLYPIKQWRDNIKIEIPNDSLPKYTPTNNPKLWLTF